MDYETLTAQSKLNAAIEAEEMNLFSLLKPKLFQDGDQFCVMLGENIQEAICGFGENPRKAIWAFNKEWDKKAVTPTVKVIVPQSFDEFIDALHDAGWRGIHDAQHEHIRALYDKRT